jgi:hypothetical protein
MNNARQKLWAPLAAVAVVVCLAGTASAQNVPLPRATGPVAVTWESYPFAAQDASAPVTDLSKLGYVEEEYIVTGTANVYDWAPDGTVTVKSQNGAYGTRILVRRPANAARFNGTVLFEPLFAARRFDWPMMWGYAHNYIVESGAAWVGVTLPASVQGMLKFNPTRYAQLSFKNPSTDSCPTSGNAAPGGFPASPTEEGLKFDMFAQIAALLKSGNLNGLRAQYVFATGQGGDLPTFINTIHGRSNYNGKPVFDGYLMRPGVNPVRINECSDAPGANDPRRNIKAANVPVVVVAAQGETLANLRFRRADSDAQNDIFRFYEVAGVGHIDWWAYYGFPRYEDQVAAVGSAQGPANWPFAVTCQPPISLFPTPVLGNAYNAVFQNLDQFVRRGTELPASRPLELRNAGTPEQDFVYDQHGHGVGGVRSVYIDVPIANYFTFSPGPGVCREMGYVNPWSWAKLEQVYGSYRNYTARAEQAIDRLVRERWLTPGDAQRAKSELTQGFLPAASRSNNN